MTATIFNVAGLIATLVGVLLLFRFGMPYRLPQINEGSLFADKPTEQDRRLNRRYRFWGWVGLVLIVLGTLAQITAALLSASWS